VQRTIREQSFWVDDPRWGEEFEDRPFLYEGETASHVARSREDAKRFGSADKNRSPRSTEAPILPPSVPAPPFATMDASRHSRPHGLQAAAYARPQPQKHSPWTAKDHGAGVVKESSAPTLAPTFRQDSLSTIPRNQFHFLPPPPPTRPCVPRSGHPGGRSSPLERVKADTRLCLVSTGGRWYDICIIVAHVNRTNRY
jgi:hypothetical protein